MADFFLWVDGPFVDQIRRLSVTDDVSGRLEQVLATGSQELLGVQELIPLENEPFQPDETEAWLIEDFQLPELLGEPLSNPIGVPIADRQIQHGRVKCLIGSGFGQNGDIVAFQVMDRRQQLTAEGLSLILQRDVFRRLEEPGLLIGDDVHAVHTDGRLIFKSLWWARRIFDLEEHYVEATGEQVEAFVERPDIVVRQDDFAEKTSQWERKRISYLVQSGLLDETRPAEIRDKAAQYEIDVELEGDGNNARLVIPEDSSERRILLKFLEEDYYEGPLTERKYVANSKRQLGGGG